MRSTTRTIKECPKMAIGDHPPTRISENPHKDFMAAPTKLAQQMRIIADSWVKDPFRPNLQLQVFLQSLASHPRLTPQVIGATRTLRDNEVQKQYPLSKKMLQPASVPYHYDRLLEGYQKSQLGIGRPWWKIFFGIW